MSGREESLSIGDVVVATGVREATLRGWESRYGFPTPAREPSGRRRYTAAQVEAIRRVVRQREAGISLSLAIERAKADGAGPPSLFARLRSRRPDLQPMRVRKPYMTKLAWAVEDECAAHAERGVLIGAFQRDPFYRRSERRWRQLAAGADVTFVLAAFDELRRPEGGPVEVPVDPTHPVTREWGLVRLAPGHCACLLGWEAPGSAEADSERAFEALLSVEPAVVREAAATAAAIAEPAAPAVAATVRERLAAEPFDPDVSAQLRLSSAITARMVASLG